MHAQMSPKKVKVTSKSELHTVQIHVSLVCYFAFHYWASTQENLSSEVCEQQRRRPACASAQSDQRLCYSHTGKYHIQTSYQRNFNILASLCSWGDWFESRFHGNPENRFSRDEAHIREEDVPRQHAISSHV